MIANNARLTDVGSDANRQRASRAGRQQAVGAGGAGGAAGRRAAGGAPAAVDSGRCSTGSATQSGVWPHSSRP